MFHCGTMLLSLKSIKGLPQDLHGAWMIPCGMLCALGTLAQHKHTAHYCSMNKCYRVVIHP